MKLVMAIIRDDETIKLTSALNREVFQVTKLASTGGFLRIGNATLLMGVEEERLQRAMDIIQENCKTKKQMTVANQSFATNTEGYIPYPVEVTYSGATVFVMDVNQFQKF